ncbi:hypothetical protein AUG19_02165 [archaeon 13_1_20CM_2_54_9]|nr:MAG: hypothetical protein AUJ07_11580 [Crenarchaeota archaeon 13_1_40CM_3_53_5]OLE76721.1 MAG: hypothetical protein AUG19_02165 [archaeon 13_1_20CM_2_54_9]TMI26655.1 MAG: DNA helicase UvrD [Candidatus Bathyarchaeota archaeon]TMI30504.1 MAG: DNA helicase UvrD [Candidatus Bathyarchaeota archaeon]
MRIIADLQVHSPYSRATSQNMNLKELDHFAQLKGLTVVGTGDFTQPDWRSGLSRDLKEDAGSGLYRLKSSPSSIRFMITGEVNTTFAFEDRSRRVHHCLLAPSLESAGAVSDRLHRFGNLASDGRPILKMSAPELVDEVLEADPHCVVFPAHAWTPWFGVFGSNSGFDSIRDCYQERMDRIFALETGMSSDPAMNWRLSQLDNFCLVSNSDAHSAWPWRLGREANVFEFDRPTYDGIVDAIRTQDTVHFSFTIETAPAYGKYHWTGHRPCGISMSGADAKKAGNNCPKCGKKMTRGVEERVEELADRKPWFEPEGAIGFRHLLPLSEIIGLVIGEQNPGSAKVWEIYNALTKKLQSEYSIMLDASADELVESAGLELASAILKVRSDNVRVEPGYDGVYGKIHLDEAEPEAVDRKVVEPLQDWC